MTKSRGQIVNVFYLLDFLSLISMFAHQLDSSNVILIVLGNLESDIYFEFLLIKEFFVHLPLTRGRYI